MPVVGSFPRTEEQSSIRPRTTLDASSVVDGRYRVLGRLAQGGMGIVYRAEDVLLQRPAALKVVDPAQASAHTLELFRREARALARLRHENVVQIYAFGTTGPSYYFAMEYVDGRDLDELLRLHREQGRNLPLEFALEIVGKVASGLTAAHARSVTHRDVKPANVVIESETSRPVLVDFGIARQASDAEPESLSGTPTYMAPEYIKNEAGHDGARADLYSFACTAFEILCGRPPFLNDHPYEVMFEHLEVPPPLLSSFVGEYESLDAVFARALAKNPKYRHESCLAFAEALRLAARSIPRRVEPKAAEGSPSPTMLGALILAEEDGLRRALVREAARALGALGIGHPVRCVDSAAALYEEAQRRRASVIVIDDDAAAGASLELARRIRRLDGGAGVPLIVLTRDMLADRSVWQELDAKRLSKPLSARALTSTLEELVRAAGRPV